MTADRLRSRCELAEANAKQLAREVDVHAHHGCPACTAAMSYHRHVLNAFAKSDGKIPAFPEFDVDDGEDGEDDEIAMPCRCDEPLSDVRDERFCVNCGGDLL